MFRIGDFSRIARVSARLLRFYDEIGVLTPARLDAQTGYRYYSVDQLAQLNRIVVLKDLGFELDQVRDLLTSDIGIAELRRILLLRRSDVAWSLAAESQRLHRIEARLAQLESEGSLELDDVVVRPEPERLYLSLRRTVTSFGAGRELIAELRAHARPFLARARPPTLIAIAHSPHFEQDEIDVEFGYALEEQPEAEALEGYAPRPGAGAGVDQHRAAAGTRGPRVTCAHGGGRRVPRPGRRRRRKEVVEKIPAAAVP